MPLVRVDAKCDVLLHVLDATHVAIGLPRELIVRRPSSAHAEKGGMRDSLCVCRDAVVLHGSEVDVLRTETRHDFLHEVEVGIWRAMFDQHQGLSLGVDTRAMEGVYRDDADVFREMLFERLYLRCLTRGLSAYDGADFGSCTLVSVTGSSANICHTWTESLHDSINVLCLHAVDDEVAAA